MLRPGPSRTAGDHEKRIRALERNKIAPDVAYYEINESSHPSPGLQAFTMNLISTNAPHYFDISGTRARVQPGVYTVFAQLDFGQTVEFTTPGADSVDFGMEFPIFPLYIRDSFVEVIPITSTRSALIRAMHFTGNMVCDVARTMRLFLDAPVGSATGLGTTEMYVERVRDYDWTF